MGVIQLLPEIAPFQERLGGRLVVSETNIAGRAIMTYNPHLDMPVSFRCHMNGEKNCKKRIIEEMRRKI